MNCFIIVGEIKKVGTKAAICIVFDVFTATVFANDDAEVLTRCDQFSNKSTINH